MSMRGACSQTHYQTWILLLVLGFLFRPLSIQANEFREGLDAYLDGDYEMALALWGPLGENGNAAAQHGLGTLYDAGRGVPQDYRQATSWFRLAAEQGHAAAQFSLGNAYAQGHGVPQDSRLAEHWWLRAAEKDFVPAQYSLGNLYQSGTGTRRDETKALEWYRRAARNGSQAAQQVVDRQRPATPRPVFTSLKMSTHTPVSRPVRRHAPIQGPEIRQEAWLLEQQPGDYALQLTAGRSEENIQAFIKRHDLSDEAAYFRALRNGDEWYCLLYGTYSDYDQAKQALQALPSRLRRNRPWVRTLSSVQASIEEFQGHRSE